MKFLFREEDVGQDNWHNRFNIVKAYNNTKDTFVNTSSSCGISKADFEIIIMILKGN